MAKTWTVSRLMALWELSTDGQNLDCISTDGSAGALD